jgi:hypothetical protein
MDGTQRARIAVGLDAAGAALGAIALAISALIVWRELPRASLAIVLPGAMVAWMVTAALGWMVCEFLRNQGRTRRQHACNASQSLQ